MRRVLIVSSVLLLLLLLPLSYTVDNLEISEERQANGRAANVVISELFISPNNLVENENSSNIYGAVDWNGDGDYGKFSDQFIEVWNSGDAPQDVSSWLLSTTSGSPPCQLPYNTTLEADARLVVFRADSDLSLIHI